MDINQCKVGDQITHTKTGGVYTYIGLTLLKMDGEWLSVHSYSNYDGEIFHRFAGDFKGFKPNQ